MDAVKYFEEKKRMLNSLGRTGGECGGVRCSDCPFSHKNIGGELYCEELEILYPERAVEIIEKWSQEHPQKTFLSDFLEKYPKAKLCENDSPYGTCPENLGYCEETYCETNKLDCVACWNRPLEEQP